MEEEKIFALSIIDAYIERLENIKKNIDEEIKNRYFDFSCLGDDIVCSSMRLFKKYHRKEYDEEN